MKLLLFGQLRDVAEHLHGATVPLDGGHLSDVVVWARRQSVELDTALQRRGVRFAVDQQFADLNAPVAAESEVVFMSPLSGG